MSSEENEEEKRSKEIEEKEINEGEEEKEEYIREEDEFGNIIVYPAWSKKNAPKENRNKWDVPIYM